MIMIKPILTIWIFTLLVIIINSCENSNSNKYAFENMVVSNDTCKVVSHDHYFFECYGQFTNPIKLQDYFTKKFTVQKEFTYAYKDSSMIDTLYRVVNNKSFIKFLYVNSSDEKESMQIVSARINDPELLMTNGLKIGLEKRLVLTMLFGKRYNHDLDKINNYQIITALEGLWINLGFVDEKLSKIIIYSDYQVDQK